MYSEVRAHGRRMKRLVLAVVAFLALFRTSDARVGSADWTEHATTNRRHHRGNQIARERSARRRPSQGRRRRVRDDADDYLQIDTDGRVLNKAATLERIKSSYARLVANPVDDLAVRVYGDTNILTARAWSQGVLDGKEFTDALRYTRIYVKRDGRWQVVPFQQTRVVDSTR
jgi:uncharacterized protein DUF4440